MDTTNSLLNKDTRGYTLSCFPPIFSHLIVLKLSTYSYMLRYIIFNAYLFAIKIKKWRLLRHDALWKWCDCATLIYTLLTINSYILLLLRTNCYIILKTGFDSIGRKSFRNVNDHGRCKIHQSGNVTVYAIRICKKKELCIFDASIKT